MQSPIDCDEINFVMIDNVACGNELDYIGCCDAMGDAWYCLDGFTVYEVCGA